jgi:hypothetical protein
MEAAGMENTWTLVNAAQLNNKTQETAKEPTGLPGRLITKRVKTAT